MKELLIKARQVQAMYLKDLFQIIYSPMFLVIAGVCCLLWGFSYVRNFFEFASYSMTMSFKQPGQEGVNIHRALFIPLVVQMNLLLLFIVPALTMRLFAEEKKLNTFDLLMSAPLSTLQIVLGKFFAAYKCSLILMTLSFLYILMTSFFADFHWTTPLLAYAGMALVLAVYVSLGVVASTLTRSVVLSVILGVIFNLFLWFLNQAEDLTNNAVVLSVVDYLSVSDHLLNFAKGTVVTSSLSFFIILTAFFLFLAVQIIETSRWGQR